MLKCVRNLLELQLKTPPSVAVAWMCHHRRPGAIQHALHHREHHHKLRLQGLESRSALNTSILLAQDLQGPTSQLQIAAAQAADLAGRQV